MEFSIYRQLHKHPQIFRIARLWIRIGLPVPGRIKRQLANEIHVEMITRILDVVAEEGSITLERALKIHFLLGQEIAGQVKQFLSIDPINARDLSRIVDFLHDLLLIRGKRIVTDSSDLSVSHWDKCSLYQQLQRHDYGYLYCDLFQEMYKGVLSSINPEATANTLKTTRSRGCEYCELKTCLKNESCC